MLEYMTLTKVDIMPYRSRRGSALRLHMEGAKQKYISYIHQTTQEQFDYWTTRIGDEFPMRVRQVMVLDRLYPDVKIADRIKR